MYFAIYGAGAIGGLIAARLIEGGNDVAVIARGATLSTIGEHGIHIRSKVFGDSTYKVRAVENPADLGPVDVVVLAVKAHSLTAIAPQLSPLFGPDTICLTTQNGIPWWYFAGIESRWAGAQLESVDPGGIRRYR